jgi:hypothetical protein
MDFDVARGHVVVHTKGNGGEDNVDGEKMSLPADVSNGLLITLLADVGATELPLPVSFVAATPAPRLVKLVISKVGSARFSVGDTPRTATDYLVRHWGPHGRARRGLRQATARCARLGHGRR